MREQAPYVTDIPIGQGQRFLVATCPSPHPPAAAARIAYRQIASILATHSLAVVHERVFASHRFQPPIADERCLALGDHPDSTAGPVTWIQGHPSWGEGLAGVIVLAVESDRVRPLYSPAGQRCGRRWTTGDCTFTVLQGIDGVDSLSRPNSRQEQCTRMFERAGQLLEAHGSSFDQVIRTWFYLDAILDWYDEFNQVRSRYYDKCHLRPRGCSDHLRLPSSTGIGGQNPNGTAGMMDLLAFSHQSGAPEHLINPVQLRNTGQRDAFLYGSAFSRGTLIPQPYADTIELSGTAAIDEQGHSMFARSVTDQIDCTFDKIDSLVQSTGAAGYRFAAATAFVKQGRDATHFWQRARRIQPDFPAVCVIADICREELAFELDARLILEETSR